MWFAVKKKTLKNKTCYSDFNEIITLSMKYLGRIFCKDFKERIAGKIRYNYVINCR